MDAERWNGKQAKRQVCELQKVYYKGDCLTGIDEKVWQFSKL